MNIKEKQDRLLHFFSCLINPNEFKNSVRKYPNPIYKIVFDTLEQVKNNQFSPEDISVFDVMNIYRNQLAESTQKIDYEVFNSPIVNEVQNIYKRATSPEIWCKFHYLLAKNFQAKNYLEIGTNLGVSGSYILSAIKNHPDGKFITMEGVPKLYEIAENHFSKIASASQYRIIKGLYQDTMPEMSAMPVKFDMAFIDGNHKYEPTLEYYYEIKKKTNNKAILIFDDIYISDQMKKVWSRIKKDDGNNFIVDLCKVGIVIIDKEEKIKGIHTKYFLA